MKSKNSRNCYSILISFAFQIVIGLCFFTVQLEAQSSESLNDSANTDFKSYRDANAENDGGSQRVNSSGKLRMLSQRISAASCALINSGNPKSATVTLNTASAEYNKILNALYAGDTKLGIPGIEKKRRVIDNLDKVSALWGPFHGAVKNILAGEKVEESMALISETNLALLKAADRLVTAISTGYAGAAELTEAEALLINYSGRQRMLTQKIAKESCAVISGNPALGDLESLNKTISLFERTLSALHDGMPSVGIKPPLTEEIRAGLQGVADDWNGVKSILDVIVEKGSLDNKALDQLYDLLFLKLKEMNRITGLYTKAAIASY